MPNPSPSQFVNPAVGLNTLQDVLDLVNMHAGREDVYWRFLLVDWNLQPVNLPKPPNPQIPNDIGAFVMSCTWDDNAERDVVRQMNLVLEESPGLAINPLIHRLMVRVIFNSWDHTQLLDVPFGVYRFVLPDRSLEDAINTWSGSYQDHSGRLATKKFINEYVTAPSATGTGLYYTLMTADPRPLSRGGSGATPAGCDHNGLGWPPSLLEIVSSALTLPASITWDYKTKQMAAINGQIAPQMLYWKPWNLRNGVQRFQPNPYQYVDPLTGLMAMPQAEWTYEYGRDSILDGPLLIKYPDGTRIVNADKVIAENNGQATITAEAVNYSLDSLASVLNYPDWEYEVIEDPNITSPAVAQARALVELQAFSQLQQTYEFVTGGINPFTDIHTFLDMRFNSPDGSPEVNTSVYPLEVQSVSTDLATRSQRYTAKRVVALGPVV